MHLAAFVDDVFGGKRQLTVYAEPPAERTRTAVAGALPGTAVRIETDEKTAAARLLRVGEDRLALAVAPDATSALVLDGSLTAIDTVSAHRATPIAGVDESTILLADPSPAVLRAGAAGVASLARSDPDRQFHATTNVIDELASRRIPSAARAYGPEPDTTARSEFDGAHLALTDGPRDGGAALVAVPDGGGHRGFLTFRSAIVSDVEAYLERTYGQGRRRTAVTTGT